LPDALSRLHARAADPDVKVSYLVREALSLATQLRDEEEAKWLRAEMNGYPTMREAPEYRWTTGRVEVFNVYRGWIPVAFESPEEEKRITRVATTQGIGEIEALLEKNQGFGRYGVGFPPFVANQITRGNRYLSNPMVKVESGVFDATLDHVRNRIFEWTLKSGATASFSGTGGDREDVKPTVVISGSLVDSQVQIGNSGSSMVAMDQPIDIAALLNLIGEARAAVAQSEFPSAQRLQLEADLASLEAQARAPKPRGGLLKALGTMVSEGLKSAGTQAGIELAKHFLRLPLAK
jgi:hypothetical protein